MLSCDTCTVFSCKKLRGVGKQLAMSSQTLFFFIYSVCGYVYVSSEQSGKNVKIPKHQAVYDIHGKEWLAIPFALLNFTRYEPVTKSFAQAQQFRALALLGVRI
jgi:hypothetical protein